ncbi:MAG: response regulator transcription factor [Tannerella sp.]|jgi:DNA-binding NarL/FixJ family response regulator|nr:response regulator transcription factor [Tannerella sp.]
MKQSVSTPKKKKIKIQILEDDQLFLDLFSEKAKNSDEIDLQAMYDNPEECLQWLNALTPDLLIIDIKLLPQKDDDTGLTFCEEVHRKYPYLKIMMLSHYGEYTYVKHSFEKGAHGYVWKNISSFAKTVEAIRSVMDGDKISPIDLSTPPPPPEKKYGLTPRQLQILRMLCEGKTQRNISIILNRAPETIKSHVENMKRAVGVNNTASLTSKAASEGWV